MSWANPNTPNIADFLLFVSGTMQVPATDLPADSEWPQYALNQALFMTPQYSCVPALAYTLATYNCAGHLLIENTPDQPGMSFFADARKSFDLLRPLVGVVQSAGDQGTNSSVVVPQSFSNLTAGDLQFIRTPYGRYYLAYCQDYGTAWGLS